MEPLVLLLFLATSVCGWSGAGVALDPRSFSRSAMKEREREETYNRAQGGGRGKEGSYLLEGL